MPRRAGLALLLFALAILPSQSVLSQEAPLAEGNAKFSRTHCEVVSSCVQKVLYFSNISQPSDLQDVVNALRVIAEIQRVQQIISGSILVIEGTPEQVALAEKLAAEIDKGKRRFGGLGYRIDSFHSSVSLWHHQGGFFASLLFRDRGAPGCHREHKETTAYTGSERPWIRNSTNSLSERLPRSHSIECRILIENEHTHSN